MIASRSKIEAGHNPDDDPDMYELIVHELRAHSCSRVHDVAGWRAERAARASVVV